MGNNQITKTGGHIPCNLIISEEISFQAIWIKWRTL